MAIEQLRGKVALVTGGGRGLGEAICCSLADVGVTVVAADIRLDLAEGVAMKARNCGSTAMALELNVADEVQAREAIGRVLAEYGHLDVLVNNAGVDVTLPVEELSFDEWDRIIGTNLRGPFVMAKHALPVMRKQGDGHIVNIVSTAAKRAWANASAYHASKWGLLGFSHALHVEARQHRVKVTAIVTGGMRTQFLLERFPDIDQDLLQDPRNVAETIRFILAQPAETVIPEVVVIPVRETSWP